METWIDGREATSPSKRTGKHRERDRRGANQRLIEKLLGRMKRGKRKNEEDEDTEEEGDRRRRFFGAVEHANDSRAEIAQCGVCGCFDCGAESR